MPAPMQIAISSTHRPCSDIVGQLQAKGASSTADFEWQMQLRYYWEEDDLVVRQVRAWVLKGVGVGRPLQRCSV